MSASDPFFFTALSLLYLPARLQAASKGFLRAQVKSLSDHRCSYRQA